MNDQKNNDVPDFPSNSKFNKASPESEKTKKVISGAVKTKKKSFGKKVGDTFLENDSQNVVSYFLHDVVIQAIKSMICDLVGWDGIAEMILFGDRRGQRDRKNSNRFGSPHTNYGAFSRERDHRTESRSMSKIGRARHDFNEIILESYAEAETVRDHMADYIEEYGMVTVADLYDFVGISGYHTDNKYGWIDLHGVRVRRVRDGYLLDLPRTQLLE